MLSPVNDCEKSRVLHTVSLLRHAALKAPCSQMGNQARLFNLKLRR